MNKIIQMKKIYPYLIALSVWAVFSLIQGRAALADELPAIDDLLKKIQYNTQLTTDVSSKVVMTQQKAGQGTKVITLVYYRRDEDSSFLIVISSPENEKGNGYLRVDDNFWMYRINTRTFQHVNRDESIAGTDAKGDDFEDRNLTEMYQSAKDASGKDIISETLLGKVPVYQFEITAKINDVDYPKKIYWVEKANLLVLKEQSYSLSGTLMETAYYRKYTQINGKYVPVEHLYIDEFEKGNKTIVEISDISLDRLDDKIFTKAYLENLSK